MFLFLEGQRNIQTVAKLCIFSMAPSHNLSIHTRKIQPTWKRMAVILPPPPILKRTENILSKIQIMIFLTKEVPPARLEVLQLAIILQILPK